MLYGYVTVTTKHQRVEVHVDELVAAGVEQASIVADIG